MEEKNNIARFYLYFNFIVIILFFILLYAGAKGYLSSNARAASNLIIFIIFGVWWVTNLIALIVSLIKRQNLQIIFASLCSVLTPLFIYIVAVNSTGPAAQLIDSIMLAVILTINLVLCAIALKTN